MTTINHEIKKSESDVFRRAYIKRRNAITGNYESDWYEITNYVMNWGSIVSGTDDIKLNTFKQSGVNLTVSNNEGRFNKQDDANSLWYGYLTRYKTLVRITAGYTDSDNTITTDIIYGANLIANGNCESTTANYPLSSTAARIVHLGYTTASNYDGNYGTRGILYGPAIGFLKRNVSALEVGSKYQVSFWAGIGGFLRSSYIYDYQTNSLSNLGYTITGSGITGSFRQIEYVAQTTTVNFFVYFSNPNPSNGYWSYDAVTFRKISTQTVSEIDNVTQGIFVMNEDIINNGDTNQCNVRCNSLNYIFDSVKANEIGGIYSTLTASEIVAKIRDATDGTGKSLFEQVIPSANWNIQTSSTYYNFYTNSSLDGISCWGLINKLAESEGYLAYISRKGNFHFEDRTANTTTSTFNFIGLGYRNINIKNIKQIGEGIDKVYNYITCKFNTADTTTSYANYGTTTSVNPSNTAWLYGQRVYEFENIYLNTTSAQSVCTALYNLYYEPKQEVVISTKLIPHLELLDNASLYYRSYDLASGFILGVSRLNIDRLGNTAGNFIDYNGTNFKIINKKINLQNFECEFKLKQI